MCRRRPPAPRSPAAAAPTAAAAAADRPPRRLASQSCSRATGGRGRAAVAWADRVRWYVASRGRGPSGEVVDSVEWEGAKMKIDRLDSSRRCRTNRTAPGSGQELEELEHGQAAGAQLIPSSIVEHISVRESEIAACFPYWADIASRYLTEILSQIDVPLCQHP